MKVQRFFLDLKKMFYQHKRIIIPNGYEIFLDEKRDFNLNKFFYKNVGLDHFWRDRLVWTDKEWLNYVSNLNFETWILKKGNDLIGYYEQEFHPSSNEVELINMGILKEYRGKKFGSLLLSHSIKSAFLKNPERMWVHTCSLDHEYALKNYKSKGFKIFKEEEVDFLI
jgi:ribosomal protein S18 acetylase RimI-like enzyme